MRFPRNPNRNIYVVVAKYFFPSVLIIWLLLIAKSAPNRKTPTKSLRGFTAEASMSMVSSPMGRIEPTHAIIVAGHAVLKVSKLSVADQNDLGWHLLGYQKDIGYPSIIKSHIQAGIGTLTRDAASSILIFSGGQTRRDAGPISEGASYFFVAKEKKWITDSLIPKIYLEEHARDSFENLLFSLCRFKEITGTYPTKVTVIGFDFKEKRFTQLHRHALGFPEHNFTYVGLKPQHPNFNHIAAANGEKNAFSSFTKDLYGCNDPALQQKRRDRNPYQRTIPYELSCPELSHLLRWCGPSMFQDLHRLPWYKGDL